jgi:hypothetical protein
MEYNLFVIAAARGKKLVNTQCEFYLSSHTKNIATNKLEEMVELICLKRSYLIPCQTSRKPSRRA